MSNLETAQRMYDAFGRGDIPAVLAAMDPKVEWREAENNPYQMDGSAWVGPQTIVEKLFVPLGTDWSDFRISIQSRQAAGNDDVILQGRFSGTFRPTGKSIDAQFCHVLRFKDGKMTHFQQYTDTARLQSVMGVRQG